MTFVSLSAPAERVLRDPVRAFSVDIYSEAAQRERRYWKLTTGDPYDYCESLCETAELHQAVSIEEGGKHYQGDLGHLGPRILRELCRHVEFIQGVTDAAVSQLVAAIGARKDAVHEALNRLVHYGYIERQRRSMATGAPKMFGVPQRVQVSSLTAFPAALRERWRAVFEKKLADRRLKRSAEARQERALADGRPWRSTRTPSPRTVARMNAAGAKQVVECVEAAAKARHDEEQRALAHVHANLAELRAGIAKSTE